MEEQKHRKAQSPSSAVGCFQAPVPRRRLRPLRGKGGAFLGDQRTSCRALGLTSPSFATPNSAEVLCK